MDRVTHVHVCPIKGHRGYLYGVNLPDELQQQLQSKAAEYGLTPQEIADDACHKTAYPSAKVIEAYLKTI